MSTVTSPLNPNPKHSQPSLAAKRLLRVKEAAPYLSISPWKLRRLVQDGLLPIVQFSEGGAWRVDVRDLDAISERHKRTEAE